jgi:pilus assembly protein CpaD
MRIMNSKLILAASASAAALLAGCAGAWNGPQQALTVAEEHPITVDSQVVALTLDIENSRGGLTAMDKARLRAFAASYLASGHGLVAISAPGGTTHDAAGEALAASARSFLTEAGVDSTAVGEAVYSAADDRGGAVVLSYTHYVATPSACGDWSGMKERDWRNLHSANFGCATQNNLAAMIADPHDLVTPADSASADATARIRGLKKYREGDKTESKAGDITAKVSE